MFWPLLSGASLALASDSAHRNPKQLHGDLVKHGVTHTLLAASQLRMLLELHESGAAVGAGGGQINAHYLLNI